jgi:MFS transporter, DHA2 family, multidrug resistance protein
LAASKLPEDTAAAVLEPAGDAFTSGIHAVAIIGATVLAATATLIAVRLRHVPPLGQEDKEEATEEAHAH